MTKEECIRNYLQTIMNDLHKEEWEDGWAYVHHRKRVVWQTKKDRPFEGRYFQNPFIDHIYNLFFDINNDMYGKERNNIRIMIVEIFEKTYGKYGRTI